MSINSESNRARLLKQQRSEHEREFLRILSDGAEWTRTDLIAERNHMISENLVHSIMTDLEKRGLVTIDKRRIKGRFSSFAFVYRRAINA